MGCRRLNSHNLFWHINEWKGIDMSKRLKTNLSKLTLTLNIFACTFLILLSVVPLTNASSKSDGDYKALENDSYTIGVQAYIYSLAPVMMQRTENLFVTTPGMGHAPVNQMGLLYTPCQCQLHRCRYTNADTLYNTAFLKLGKEPIVLHVPDTNGRYYVQQMLDAYTNTFNSVGQRTTGTVEGDFAIVGPGWNSSLPIGLQVIKSPTNTVWIIGRILVKGELDLPNVLTLQKQFTLTPLSQYGKPAFTAKNETLAEIKGNVASPIVQDNIRFFEELRVALKNNQPAAGEAALMAVFDRIGLGKNETPYGTNLDPAIADGLSRAIKDGDQIVNSSWKNLKGFYINGWTYNTKIGTYGYNSLLRAAVTEGVLGANVPEEAIYAKTQTGTDGQPLSGANNYLMHFDKGNLPPVNAFWSLSIYNATTFMFVPNSINRYSVNEQKNKFVYNPDGSLDIYVQHEESVVKESNWLPAPKGDFSLILRMYLPGPKVLNGTYQIPQVQKVV
jgi:hypothetical protein